MRGGKTFSEGQANASAEAFSDSQANASAEAFSDSRANASAEAFSEGQANASAESEANLHDVLGVGHHHPNPCALQGGGGGLQGLHDLLVQLAVPDGVELRVHDADPVPQLVQPLLHAPPLHHLGARPRRVVLAPLLHRLARQALGRLRQRRLAALHVAAALLQPLLRPVHVVLGHLPHHLLARPDVRPRQHLQQAVHPLRRMGGGPLIYSTHLEARCSVGGLCPVECRSIGAWGIWLCLAVFNAHG